MFCNQCGELISDGAIFCGNCGCRVGAESVKKAGNPDTSKAAHKKKAVHKKTKKLSSRKWIAGIGITAAVAVVASVAVVTVLYAIRSPFYELQKAVVNLSQANSFKVKMKVSYDSESLTTTYTYVYDEDSDSITTLLTSDSSYWSGMYAVYSEDDTYLVYDNSSYVAKSYYTAENYDYYYEEGDTWYIVKDDNDTALYQVVKYLRGDSDSDAIKELEDLFEENDMDVDIEGFVKELQGTFSDEKFLTDTLGYEKTKSGKEITYSFEPDMDEIYDTFFDILEEYVDDDDVFDLLKEGVDYSMDDLEGVEYKFDIVVSDGMLTEISMDLEMDDEKAKIKFTFSDIGEASIPKSARGYQNALKEYLD